ncbi:metal-dependent phosphohydrolase, partial [Neobacillus drentensis]
MIPHEEKQTVKWYLLISYILLIGYDVFYYYIRPKYLVTDHQSKIGFPSKIWYVTYVVLLILLPIALYLIKVNKQYW